MEAVDDGNIVGPLFRDISKAFGTVPHQKLINELSRIGYSLQTVNLFMSYLAGRQQRVA